MTVNFEIKNIQDDSQEEDSNNLLSLTTRIVASHLSNAQVATPEIPSLIETVHAKLKDISARDCASLQQEPALPISESVTPDYIFCLEDGKKFRMLKKHLRSCYNMSPEEYRAKWGLGPDYPMVAPNYAVKRQELAKISGLGKKRT